MANALSRIEQSEDRDILQGHYSNIQQELQVKTDALKSQRQKVYSSRLAILKIELNVHCSIPGASVGTGSV